MDLQLYSIIVTLCALVYSFVTRKIQLKFVDNSKSKELQKKSRELNEQLKVASKRGDENKVNEIMKQQMGLIAEMNKVMFSSFKGTIPMLVILLSLMYILSVFDPTTVDDITIWPLDDGNGCDKLAGDGIYSLCYNITNNGNNLNGNSEEWLLTANIIDGKDILGHDSSTAEQSKAFFVGPQGNVTYIKQPKGPAFDILGLKESYNLNERMEVFIKPEKGKPKVSLNNGTWFYVDLPIAIPLLNIKRINEIYWWFIFVVLMASLARWIYNTYIVRGAPK